MALRFFLRAAISVIAIGMTGACSQSTAQSPELPSSSKALAPTVGERPGYPTGSDNSLQRIPASVSKHDLLYVANNYDVTVYSYPRGELKAKLKHHFFRPATECSDKAGNVYITDGDNVFVYAHGGKKPFRTLTYSGALTTGCSSDPTTGDLAVTYEFGFSKAYLAVYPHANGSPKLYQVGNLIFARCGYDASGNLYADGTYGSGQDFGLVKLPKGGGKLKLITLNQSFENPGPIQWDGKYITIGDNQAENIYRFGISGSHGTLIGTTSLAGASDTMINWWIEGSKVIGANSASPPAVYYWSYPAGGNPIKTLSKGLLYPAGVTISKGKD